MQTMQIAKIAIAIAIALPNRVRSVWALKLRSHAAICRVLASSGVWNLLLTSHFLLIQIMAKFETQPLYACLFVDYIH